MFIFYMADLHGIHGHLSKYADDLVSVIRIPRNATTTTADADTIYFFLHIEQSQTQPLEMSTNDHFRQCAPAYYTTS